MEVLKFSCKLGILSRPDGSVLFSEGDTTVIAGIYGPVEVRQNKFMVEKASVETHFRPKAGFPGVKDRFHEAVIKDICEATIAVSLYPRASVLIVIQELQNDGQLISCAINAICLAALESGIDMKCMFAAVTGFLDKEGKLDLSPPVNKNDLKASFLFVFESVNQAVIASHTEGSFTEEQFGEILPLCRGQSVYVFNYFKKTMAIK